MKKLLTCIAAWATLFAATALAQAKPDLADTWQGTIDIGHSIRVVFKIEKAPNGGYASTFYSIDQPSPPFKASRTTLDGSAVSIVVDTIGLEYNGKLSPDGSSIVGTGTQGGGDAKPLTLVRATPTTAWVIPEPPPPPKMMPADAHPGFEVATIKPNDTGANGMQQLTFDGHQFVTRASSLVDLISFAYQVQAKQMAGLPEWAGRERFDIEAVPDTPGMPSVAQIGEMLRKLLAERFQLKFHKEPREMNAFVLTQGKGPLKLKETELTGPATRFGMRPAPGGLTIVVRDATMGQFTDFLNNGIMDRPVVNDTGLTGQYDLSITFTPDDSQFNGHPPPIPAATDNTPTSPGFAEALQRDAGLKIEAKKAPVGVIVIDHVERYSAN